jgi:ribosome-associated heat shock protein Hsp15
MHDDDAPEETASRLRIDKWLWAARFYKTRSLAALAVDGGKVSLEGARVKPAREVKPGDRLELRIGELHWSIEVRAIPARRGPAAEAALLYAETPESRERRARLTAMRGAGPHPRQGRPGRPTKRDRRLIRRFTGD